MDNEDLKLLDKNTYNIRGNKKIIKLSVSREHYIFLSDYINKLQNCLLLEKEYSKTEKGWRCFYCDNILLDYDEAKKHFGDHQN